MSTDGWQICFDKEPFAEGRFRYAFKGEFESPVSRKGEKVVVKKFKDSYIWNRAGWDMTTKIYSKAAEYAKEFGHGIQYTECFLGHIFDNIDSAKTALGEFVANEEYLDGEFIKWCNNYGRMSKEIRSTDEILASFMHWSWAHSRGQEMVADIQGVKQDKVYKLTDPALLSVTQEYGSTDMGIEGMAMFFLVHRCTDHCKNMPKPKVIHFVGKLSDDKLQQCLALQQLSAGATTYEHEMKLTPDERAVVTAEFLAIARGELT